MPLLRAIGAWFDRRVRDAEIYGTVAADGGMSQGAMVWVWFLIFIMALPLLAFLGLIGLIYEVIIRLDEGRLGKAIEWAVSSAVALLVVFGFYWVYVRP